MKEIKQLKEKGKPDAIKGRTDGLVAAMKIQKVWRGFTTRRKTRHGKVEEMYLIGMIPRPERNNEALLEYERKVFIHSISHYFCIIIINLSNLPMISIQQKKNQTKNVQRCERRYGIQESYRRSYENTVKEAKEDILNKYSTTLSEQIADEIRNWFKEYQNRSGKFPEFPTEENGGSIQFARQGNQIFIKYLQIISHYNSKHVFPMRLVRSIGFYLIKCLCLCFRQ